MTNADILFVAPPLLWGQEFRLDMKPPLNLLYLASWLNRKGFHTEVLDVISAGMSLPSLVERIAAEPPRYLGVPFYQATRETSLVLCRAVREKVPEVAIIAGGPLVTTFFESILESPEIDICVIGEGELTLEEILLRSFHAGAHGESFRNLPSKDGGVPANRADGDVLAGLPSRDGGVPANRADGDVLAGQFRLAREREWLSGVRGIAYRSEGETVVTPARPPIANLDDLPFLDFRLIDIQRYFAYHDSIEMSHWLFLTTSRGCPCRCTFCATPVLWPGPMRRQSVSRILAEISHQRALFPESQFGFMDDSFFSDKTWLDEFFRGIVSLNVRYCCIGRADYLLPDDVRRLSETGCIYVALGIETGNQRRQKALKKYLDLDMVRGSVRLLAQKKVFCKCFFMLGFPDETPEEMIETINFAIELKSLGMGECNFFPVSIYPGTELASHCSSRTYVSTVYENPEFSYPAGSGSQKGGDIGEKKLFRYANIPDCDVNAYFTSAQLLDIVKTAYQKVEAGTGISLSDLPPQTK